MRAARKNFGPAASVRMMKRMRSVSDAERSAVAGIIETLEPRRLFALPAGWTDLNIGSPAKLGTASFDAPSGGWTQSGGGADIWNRSDQFNFVSEHVTGSAVAIAKVASVTNTNSWAKAGLMFRNSAAANDVFVDVVVTPGQGVSLQWRSTTGGTGSSTTIAGVTAPRWLKLTRSANSFSGYYSANGTSWIQIGSAKTVTMASNALVGLAVTAHDNTKLCTATFSGVSIATQMTPPPLTRAIYDVTLNGSVAVYDILNGHHLVKTIPTVTNVSAVKGVAASLATKRMYVSYRTTSGSSMIYDLDLVTEKVLWNRTYTPGADRLSISPDGSTLYVPTGEWQTNTAYDFINVVDAATGDVKRTVTITARTHDTLYPLSGPIFQETKASDGSGRYLYEIDPVTFAVTKIGPFADFLGPYAIDSTSTYSVNNVNGVWGMQVANLKTGEIITAKLPGTPPAVGTGLMHGVAWSPDQKEVWEAGGQNNPHVYVWDMTDPMAPKLSRTLNLKAAAGSHWINFSISGDYVYACPYAGTSDPVQVFDAHTYQPVTTIAASQELLEIDFSNGVISQIGDQFGIGRK
jgi:hypothetical protein